MTFHLCDWSHETRLTLVCCVFRHSVCIVYVRRCVSINKHGTQHLYLYLHRPVYLVHDQAGQLNRVGYAAHGRHGAARQRPSVHHDGVHLHLSFSIQHGATACHEVRRDTTWIWYIRLNILSILQRSTFIFDIIYYVYCVSVLSYYVYCAAQGMCVRVCMYIYIYFQ